MDATHRIPTWSPRRTAAAFACVTALAVAAGGAGGYLVHGTTGPTASAPVAPAPALVAPAAPQRALNGDSVGGYVSGPSDSTRTGAMNGDSASGYSAGPAAAPSRGLNADSTSNY